MDPARSPCEPLGYRRQARHTAPKPCEHPHWGDIRGEPVARGRTKDPMHSIILGTRQLLAIIPAILIWALEALGALFIALAIITMGIIVALILALSWLKNELYHKA